MNTKKDQLIDFPFPCSKMAFIFFPSLSFALRESFFQNNQKIVIILYYKSKSLAVEKGDDNLLEKILSNVGKSSCWVGVKNKSRRWVGTISKGTFGILIPKECSLVGD